jgi:hypothetical protein
MKNIMPLLMSDWVDVLAALIVLPAACLDGASHASQPRLHISSSRPKK